MFCCTCAGTCCHTGPHTYCDAHQSRPYPRASRMPEHMPSVDPLFHDAAFHEFTPEETAMVKEKAGIFQKVVGGK